MQTRIILVILPDPVIGRSPIALLALVACVFLAACGRDDEDTGSADVSVVATTTHAADIARNVAGERAAVNGILEPNSDPHDYEPRPSDARALAEAELVIRSGGDLDEWLEDLLESAGGNAERLTLIDSVETIEGGEHAGEDDPHWWQDPTNGQRAVAAVRDALIKADPDGADDYRRNAERYSARLGKLDGEIAHCIDQVPAAQRKLVTTHDAFGYYARRYEIEVVGALIPSLSSQAQPSAGETARLVGQIEDEDVKAIFPESALNPKLEQAVARETGAQVVEALWADSLGPEGSDGATYLEALTSDTTKLVSGFTGGAQSCRPRA